MPNEIETTPNPSVSGANEPSTDVDYVAAIQELQNNTVSKASYDKLREDNKKLLSALVNGEKIEVEQKNHANVDELRAKLFGKGGETLNNLEYVKNALELRTELMNRGERDPFLPVGSKVQDTYDMHQSAARVAEALQQCIDESDGDSSIFTAKLQRIMVDSPFKPRLR